MDGLGDENGGNRGLPHGVAPVEEMDLVGGVLCLDLVNTGSGRASGNPPERLRTYGDLVTWSERVGVVDAPRARRLRKAAQTDPEAAERVLERARALRESCYAVFSSLSRGEDAPPRELEVLDELASSAATERQLCCSDGSLEYEWPQDDRLESLLWPVAWSAAELGTGGPVDRIKQCASETCDWLFLDESRNRSRRWCDMKDCGNRAKARRFQARQRKGG